MDSLIEHLEKHLGQIVAGWSLSADGDPMSFQVVKFHGEGAGKPVSYTTLGLSKCPLDSTASGKEIRQELLLLAPPGFGDRNIPALLQSIAAEALGLKRAYLRGEIIGPQGRLFDGLPFTSFYVTLPVYHPDSFQTVTDDSCHSIVFAWLVPITETEVRFVQTEGWGKFEDLLERRDPDLLDFNRLAVA